MHEIVFADADPNEVRHYNHRLRESLAAKTTLISENAPIAWAMQPMKPDVDWTDTTVSDDGVEVSVLFADEPEDREVQDLMNALSATALTVRKVNGVT